jgi:hypothetical protein
MFPWKTVHIDSHTATVEYAEVGVLNMKKVLKICLSVCDNWIIPRNSHGHFRHVYICLRDSSSTLLSMDERPIND